jgi:hypothetical protein
MGTNDLILPAAKFVITVLARDADNFPAPSLGLHRSIFTGTCRDRLRIQVEPFFYGKEWGCE